MIEAELKAYVRDAEGLRDRLRKRSKEELSVYQDTYYDRPDGTLALHCRCSCVQRAVAATALWTWAHGPERDHPRG